MQAPDQPETNSKLRTLELTTRERDLLLEYGYPFPDEEKILSQSNAVQGMHRVKIDAYWMEMMIGDLVRSAKEIHKQSLLNELDELCTVLELALDSRPKLHVVDF